MCDYERYNSFECPNIAFRIIQSLANFFTLNTALKPQNISLDSGTDDDQEVLSAFGDDRCMTNMEELLRKRDDKIKVFTPYFLQLFDIKKEFKEQDMIIEVVKASCIMGFMFLHGRRFYNKHNKNEDRKSLEFNCQIGRLIDKMHPHCPAFLRYVRSHKMWKLVSFDLVHNHTLTLSETPKSLLNF